MSGKVLGIIGLGEIGRAVARRASGFSMRVVYWQPRRVDPVREDVLGAHWVERESLLKTADFVCICSPLTAETYHLLGETELAMMKPSAVLVNTSRGSEVDEAAVAQALVEGRLGAYAADVFEMEDAMPVSSPVRCVARPVPAGSPRSKALASPARRIPPLLLSQRDRTVFTPHASTAVDETRVLIALAQARGVLDVLEGRKPASAVNHPPKPRGWDGPL